MSKNFLQSQQILKRCFNDVTGKLKARGGTYTMQDYLNAVYDDKNDCLRVAFDGGATIQGQSYWGQPVDNVNKLPQDAETGTLTPVLSQNSLSFYYYDGTTWQLMLSGNSQQGGSSLNEEQMEFIYWGVENKSELQFYIENKQKIQQILKNEFVVKTLIVQLPKVIEQTNNIKKVNIDIDGTVKNIIDEEDLDGDLTTHYRIDVNGYVIGLETYQNSNSGIADRYYTKQVFEKDLGEFGVTHIYMTKEEYDYFSSLQNGKNILKINYLESMFGANFVVKTMQTYIPGDIQQKIMMDDNDNPIQTQDIQKVTHYRYRINGYVTSIQSYPSDMHKQTEQVIPYIIDYNQNESNTVGYTDVYFTKQAYEQIAKLSYPKNVLKFYFLYQKN